MSLVSITLTKSLISIKDYVALSSLVPTCGLSEFALGLWSHSNQDRGAKSPCSCQDREKEEGQERRGRQGLTS